MAKFIYETRHNRTNDQYMTATTRDILSFYHVYGQVTQSDHAPHVRDHILGH